MPFYKIARACSTFVGSPYTFVLAVVLLLVWAVMGPAMKFSDTWQLIANTSTTIVTFLVVFLIQNTQNRDSEAIHIKLDELIRVSKKARNKMIDIEDLSDEQLDIMKKKFKNR